MLMNEMTPIAENSLSRVTGSFIAKATIRARMK
jgi:hypothetical protein